MSGKRLLWQLYPMILAATLGALVLFALVSAQAMRGFHVREKENELQRIGLDVAARIRGALADGDHRLVDGLCKTIGARLDMRVTVIMPDGMVLGDTDADPRRMDDRSQRPEVAEALMGEPGRAERFSQTMGTDMLYVALPMSFDADFVPHPRAPPQAILRLAVPLNMINSALRQVYVRLMLSLFGATVLAALVSYVLTRKITIPIERLRNLAQHYATGELKGKAEVSGFTEMDELSEVMQQMAGQLDERIETIKRQKSELEAVVSSMVEGVIAVDTGQRLISINQAATKLLDVEAHQVRGRPVDEVIRNTSLKAFIARVLREEAYVEEEIVLPRADEQDVHLRAHGAGLRDAENRCIGAVVVLEDQTRLKRLEQVRKDFVANVSHELKTPITSIKGFVETLQDNRDADPADQRRFLDVIDNQADRLTAIIDDLLSLSRLEQDNGAHRIELEPCALLGVLRSALQSCQPMADERQISLTLKCSDQVCAAVNAPLLEQAVVNLLDNAIKYSQAAGTVCVEAAEDEKEVVIRVVDHGCGIGKEHLERIFERFYRVNKARSRRLGGTGLGLSIVKHITQVHHGYPSVSSTPGSGSVFTIHLPRLSGY